MSDRSEPQAENRPPQPPPPAEEQNEVVIMGRMSKRKAFFDRHTGLGARVLGFAVLAVAVAVLLFRQCAGDAAEKEAGAPPAQAAAQLAGSALPAGRQGHMWMK